MLKELFIKGSSKTKSSTFVLSLDLDRIIRQLFPVLSMYIKKYINSIKAAKESLPWSGGENGYYADFYVAKIAEAEQLLKELPLFKLNKCGDCPDCPYYIFSSSSLFLIEGLSKFFNEEEIGHILIEEKQIKDDSFKLAMPHMSLKLLAHRLEIYEKNRKLQDAIKAINSKFQSVLGDLLNSLENNFVRNLDSIFYIAMEKYCGKYNKPHNTAMNFRNLYKSQKLKLKVQECASMCDLIDLLIGFLSNSKLKQKRTDGYSSSVTCFILELMRAKNKKVKEKLLGDMKMESNEMSVINLIQLRGTLVSNLINLQKNLQNLYAEIRSIRIDLYESGQCAVVVPHFIKDSIFYSEIIDFLVKLGARYYDEDLGNSVFFRLECLNEFLKSISSLIVERFAEENFKRGLKGEWQAKLFVGPYEQFGFFIRDDYFPKPVCIKELTTAEEKVLAPVQ